MICFHSNCILSFLLLYAEVSFLCVATELASTKVENQYENQRTAADPADTAVASGIVPSLLTFQI